MDFQRAAELVLETKAIVMDEKAARQVTVKGQADYVTQVDFAVQSYLKERLLALHPQAGFLAEEQENVDYSGRPAWILDPIDGTTNLIHGYQMSAVSLAFYDGQAVVFGAVYNPFTEELFTAQRGRGAYCNGVPIQCTQTREIASCLVAIGTAPYIIKKKLPGILSGSKRYSWPARISAVPVPLRLTSAMWPVGGSTPILSGI